jgi:hypothetical protein
MGTSCGQNEPPEWLPGTGDSESAIFSPFALRVVRFLISMFCNRYRIKAEIVCHSSRFSL